MAEEIAIQNKIMVRRPNREYLLRVRRGEFSYEELLKIAEEKIERIDELFNQSQLPQRPDYTQVNQLLIRTRKLLYTETAFK